MHFFPAERRDCSRPRAAGQPRPRVRGWAPLVAAAGLALIGLAALAGFPRLPAVPPRSPAASAADAAGPAASAAAPAAGPAPERGLARSAGPAHGSLLRVYSPRTSAGRRRHRHARPRRAALPAPLTAQRALAAPRAAALPGSAHRICPVPRQPGQMQCMSLLRTKPARRAGLVHGKTPPGYGPAGLRSAYGLASASVSRGAGVTVAVVDAYNDPRAAADLKVYRAQYGLPACDPATGAGCVSQVNEQGDAAPLPAGNQAWAAEESVDLDMVSAICPNCHILLVEAATNSLADLGAADNTAVGRGALFVSDSWDGAEFAGENYYDNLYFDHPGVVVDVAAGDSRYGAGWPSSSQFVTSVGGTSLTRDSASPRGWRETVWNDSYGGTGAGCSQATPRPSWQAADDAVPGGCLNRTQDDVAAVADPATGVASYDTYSAGGWQVVGGTSVATPIITAVYALAGDPAAGTYPASYLYQAGHAAGLHDVVAGSDGACEPARRYLCTAGPGFDGPSGLGTPAGTGAFRDTAAGNTVTLADPGTQDAEKGSQVYLAVQATDSAPGQSLTYSAAGLPPGLVIDPSTGEITGTLESAGTSRVTVTATDATGAHGSVSFSVVAVTSLKAGYYGVSAPVRLGLDDKCLSDVNDSARNRNKVQIWGCDGAASQDWEFRPGGEPGGPGTLTIRGKCLEVAGGGTADETPVDLSGCDGGAGQQWLVDGAAGQLLNPHSGKCLADPGGSRTDGTRLWIYACTGARNQAWTLPPGPVRSAVAGKCMYDDKDGSSGGTAIVAWRCNSGWKAERWTLERDGTIRINGKCAGVAGGTKLDGGQVQLSACGPVGQAGASQQWTIGSQGELVNVNSGMCLDDPGASSVNGTRLVQEDCYGQAGEIWAVT